MRVANLAQSDTHTPAHVSPNFIAPDKKKNRAHIHRFLAQDH